MRSLSIACLLTLTLLGSLIARAGQEPGWMTDFETAKAQAVEQHRNILVSFSGSDWCIPCMRLEKDLFSTEAFRQFTEANFVLLKLDFPARKQNKLSPEQVAHNEALAEKYNQRGSFPLVLIIDSEGVVKGQMPHPLTSTDAYIESLRPYIEK